MTPMSLGFVATMGSVAPVGVTDADHVAAKVTGRGLGRAILS